MALEDYRAKPGSPYKLDFGSVPERGLLEEMASRSATVPVVELGDDCVCCNKQAQTHLPLRGDALGDIYGGDIFKAPVCLACRGHAVAGEFALRMGIVFISLGVLFLFASIGMGSQIAMIGSAMVAVPILLFLLHHLLVKQRLKDGHYSGLEFYLSDGYVSVVTHNPRLAADLLKRYSSIAAPPK